MKSQDSAWNSWERIKPSVYVMMHTFTDFFYCIGSGEGSIKTKSSVKEVSNITVQEQVIGCPCEVNAPTASTVNLNASELVLFHSRFVWTSHHSCKSLMRYRLLWAYFLAPSDPVGFTCCGYHSADIYHLLEISLQVYSSSAPSS